MTIINPELLNLLLDQRKFAGANALLDRWVARIDWELEQEAGRGASPLGGEGRGKSTTPLPERRSRQ